MRHVRLVPTASSPRHLHLRRGRACLPALLEARRRRSVVPNAGPVPPGSRNTAAEAVLAAGTTAQDSPGERIEPRRAV